MHQPIGTSTRDRMGLSGIEGLTFMTDQELRSVSGGSSNAGVEIIEFTENEVNVIVVPPPPPLPQPADTSTTT